MTQRKKASLRTAVYCREFKMRENFVGQFRELSNFQSFEKRSFKIY
jgi:hypothetical protein